MTPKKFKQVNIGYYPVVVNEMIFGLVFQDVLNHRIYDYIRAKRVEYSACIKYNFSKFDKRGKLI